MYLYTVQYMITLLGSITEAVPTFIRM